MEHVGVGPGREFGCAGRHRAELLQGVGGTGGDAVDRAAQLGHSGLIGEEHFDRGLGLDLRG
jgi:hypothetical protein